MDSRMVYPTAPFDTQAQHPNVDVPPAHTGAGENVESPGKTMTVLSKVKNKAKKLRNRIKKVRGSNTAATEHGDNINEHGTRDFNNMPVPHDKNFDDDEVESDEDDEEDEDFHKSNKNEFKYEQLRSIGALDNQGDGSEVEVHGGVPVPAMADTSGSYWKREDNSDPISAYKSAGPPGALQATPTEYRNYAADEDISLGGVSTDRKREVGAPLEESGRSGENFSATSGPGFMPDKDASNRSYDESVEPFSKHSVSNVSDTDVPHPESFGRSNPPAEESSASTYDKIAVMEEDLSADRKLGVGLPSEHVGSGKGNGLETSVPEFEPEGKSVSLLDSESGESQSKYGVLGTGGTSASDINEPYPGDLVKPNPSFGQSSSPTHGKIAVMNNDASPDEQFGLGLSTGEHSGSGKGNLLETSVPEGEELSGYQKDGSLLPLEADELVYRPVSDGEEGSSLTSPPGKLEGAVYGRNADLQESGTGSLFQDYGTRQSRELSDKDLPASVVDSTPSKAEYDTPAAFQDDIPANYGEQTRSFDAAAEQPAGEGIDTAGDGSRENWGKWSTDKINNAKNVTVSSLIASDLKNDGNTRDKSENKSVDPIGTTDKIPDKMPESKDVDVVKVLAGEDANQDSEEEYYDPNEVKDNQFEQGFALGNAEEDALSGTLAGSAIETLQGLKDTVQSSLGYSNQHSSDAGVEDRSGPVEGEERALSPSSSQQQQKGGFVKGLRQSVASSLGYGKSGSEEEVGQDVNVLERGVKPETDLESRQQQSGGIEQMEERVRSPASSQLLSPGSSQQQQKGGFGQGLKQTVASALGYGKVGPDEEVGHNADALEGGRESETDLGSRQQQSDGLEEGKERAPSPSSSQELQKGGFVQELKETSASPLGYGEAGSDRAGYNDDDLERGEGSETDFDSRQQQPAGTYQGMKNAFVSKLGYGAASGAQSPTKTKESEVSAEPENREIHHNEDVDTHESGINPALVLSDTKDNSGKVDEGPEPSPRSRGVLQGLKDRVTSTLGYGAGSGEQSPTMTKETESREFSAESDRQEIPHDEEGETNESITKPGLVLNDAKDNAGRVDEGSEPSPRSQGVLQGLKNTVSSTLGYGAGSGEQSPTMTKVAESREIPAEPEGRGILHGEEGQTHESATKPGLVLNDAKDNAGRVDEVSEPSPRSGGVLQGLKNTVTSTLGYNSQPVETYTDTPHTEPEHEPELEPERVSSPGADHPPSSYTQKLMGTTAAARNYLFSKVGYGNSEEEKAERNIDDGNDGEKFTSPSSHEDISPSEQPNIV